MPKGTLYMSDLIISEALIKSKEQPTKKDRDRYYRYDLSLIETILHNCSTTSRHNLHSHVEYTETEAIVHRTSTEHLTIAILNDTDGINLAISVYDPQITDHIDEVTTIYFSQQEIHVLRSMLNRLASSKAWGPHD
jgi:hypothetical protein